MLKQKYKFYWVSPRGKGTRRHEVPALAVYALLAMAVIGTIGAVPVAIPFQGNTKIGAEAPEIPTTSR